MDFFWERKPKKSFAPAEDNTTAAAAADSTSVSPIDVASARLNQMSLEERSDGLHDLHGVADAIDETPEFLARKTEEFQRAMFSCLASATPEASSAFRSAFQKSEQYVVSQNLRFLRSDSYNCTLAAARMLKFFNLKLDLFGEEFLVQDIQLKHLTDADKEILWSGFVQLLPQRDRAGRLVTIIDGRLNAMYPNTKSVMRVLFYFWMTALKDEESQRKRMVGIYFGIDQKRTIPGRTAEYNRLMTSVPWGCVAAHHCTNNKMDTVLKPAIQFVCHLMESKILCRARFHDGTHMECMYQLMTFGIPRDALPFSDDGTLDVSNHHQMLQAMQTREEQQGSPPVPQDDTSETSITTITSCRADKASLVPGPMDIIMGRGRRPKSQPGALRMHTLLLEHHEVYEAAAKFEKTAIAEQILKELKSLGCRFITPTSVGFVECDDMTARAKISHGFRNIRWKKQAQGGGGGGGNKQQQQPQQEEEATLTTSRKRSLVERNEAFSAAKAFSFL